MHFPATLTFRFLFDFRQISLMFVFFRGVLILRAVSGFICYHILQEGESFIRINALEPQTVLILNLESKEYDPESDSELSDDDCCGN